MNNKIKELLSTGNYARKQLLSNDKLINWSHSGRFKKARQIISEFSGGRFLDYGCGDGSFLLLNQDFFESATGVDSNLSQIQSNKKRFHDLPKMSFTTTNDLIDGHLNAKFDVVTCMEVIEHCALPERELVLKNLNALLKPGGHVVISVPIEIGPTLLFKQLFRRIAGWRGIGDYKYIEPYSMSELIKMVMATQNTEINRPVHEHVNPPAPPLKLHSHKGFNWRALKKRLNQDFIIDQTYFSPIPINQGLVNSQVFFVCRKPDSTQ